MRTRRGFFRLQHDRRVANVLAFGCDTMRWQRFKHRPRSTQVGRLEALGKSIVYWCKDLSRLVVPTQPHSQACKTHCAPQFPHQRALPPSHLYMGRLRCKVDRPNEAPMIRNVRGEGFVLSATLALSKNSLGLRRAGAQAENADSNKF